MSKSCFWLFFENTNAEEFITKIETIQQTDDNISYICGQLERGTHTHAQCYIQLNRAQSLSWLKRVVSPTASFTIQFKKASADDGVHYCSKPHEGCECKECVSERLTPTAIEDTFVEYGILRKKSEGAGKRNDIKALYDIALTHCKEREVMANEDVQLTYVTHMKFYERARMLNRPPSLETIDCRLYVGVTGSGKTTGAFAVDEDYYDVPINNGTMWFDGYDQNNVLIFDDFAGKVDHMTLVSTLKLLDRHARRIPVKGTMTWLRSPIKIVTTNYHPRFWYNWKEREESYKAITRRFTSVHIYTEPHEDVFEVEILNTRHDIREYFNNRDLWPTEYYGMDPPFNS